MKDPRQPIECTIKEPTETYKRLSLTINTGEAREW